MNKNLLAVVTILVFGTALFAQDKAEVNVKITKDGQVLKDTVYTYDDLEQAKHVVHMMEMLSGDDMHFEASDSKHMKMMASSGDSKKHKMIFISEDGDVSEFGDMDMEWTSEEGDSVKVIKVRSNGKATAHAWVSDDMDEDEHVIINEGDGTVEVIVKKIKDDGSDETVKEIRKEIVIESDDTGEETTEWTVEEGENGEMVLVSDNGKKIILTKESEKNDAGMGKTSTWTTETGDNVNVVVVKKENKDGDEVEMDVTIKETKDKKDKKKK